jgi:CheY-like chemotaxis protein
MEQIARLIEAVTPLLWMALILYLIQKFSPEIKDFLAQLKDRDIDLEISGQKINLKKYTDQQSKLVTDLQAQVQTMKEKVWPAESRLSNLSAPAAPMPPAPNTVLWVDDQPENNILIVKMIRDRGIAIEIAESTDAAMRLFNTGRFGAVVSDMGRTEDGKYIPDAGMILLKKLRDVDPQIPFIFYASASKVREYHDLALQSGANKITSSPSELSGLLLKHFGMLQV